MRRHQGNGAVVGGEPPARPEAALEVSHLTVDYILGDGQVVSGVRDVSLEVGPGEKIAIVGESGSGKSTLATAVLGLLPDNSRVRSGEIRFDRISVLEASDRELRALRGLRLSRVPQDPLRSLNPVLNIGAQMRDVVRAHLRIGDAELDTRLSSALRDVGLSGADRLLRAYPHELSGGMRQRVLLAMALLHKPQVVVADEPTTALDSTVQAQILDLLDGLVDKYRMSLVLITHDLAIASKLCQRVVIMYRGEVVEAGRMEDILGEPLHPYTALLLAAAGAPTAGWGGTSGQEAGSSKAAATAGGDARCAFAGRCPVAIEMCFAEHPELLPVRKRDTSAIRCFLRQ
ncbi:MAG: ABC transporter ATP-binding protein [Actinomycetota bacterium]|nr:ABC transporter ATP-binding protein [Actinomycetota bacterium]